MKLKTHAKKDKLKWILTFGAVALLSVVVVSLCATLGRMGDTTKIANSNYHIGVIDTTTGNILESKKHIYSDMNTVEGLDIDLKENATVTYKVAFYDEDKGFVSITDSLSVDFDAEDIPETAGFFRIEITPFQVDNEDVVLSIFNMNKYFKMVDVTFAK